MSTQTANRGVTAEQMEKGLSPARGGPVTVPTATGLGDFVTGLDTVDSATITPAEAPTANNENFFVTLNIDKAGVATPGTVRITCLDSAFGTGSDDLDFFWVAFGDKSK